MSFYKMKKELIIFLCFLLIFILINNSKSSSIQVKKVQIDERIYVNVEIADEDYEREKGLMFRDNLEENSGMLFVFYNESLKSFWMKNTFIPLDMIFINKEYEIINIENAIPCLDNECISYSSKFPTKYVLEVNSGFCYKNNIHIGDKVKFLLED